MEDELNLMDRDLWIITVVVVIFLLFAGLLAAFGGVKEETHLRIRDIDLKAEAVDESEANITAMVTVEHEGDAARDVELLVKLYDGETGLLMDEKSAPVGTIECQSYIDGKGVMQEMDVIVIEKGKSSVETSLLFTVPREGSYRVRAELFEDEKFLRSQDAYISGLSTLEVRGDVALRIRDVDFYVNKTSGDRTLVDVTAYIDNLKSKDTPKLVMLIKAEDSGTGLLVDSRDVDLGTLSGSETSIRSTSLSLLSERDHIIDLQIWNEGRIVAEGWGWVGLSPFGYKTEFIPVTGTLVEKGAEVKVEDFISPEPMPTPDVEMIPYEMDGMAPRAPGFGMTGVIFALLIALLMRRNKHGR